MLNRRNYNRRTTAGETITALPQADQGAASRRRASPWRRLRQILIIVVALIGVAAVLLYWQVYQLARVITVADVRPNPPLATPLLGANVLIIGVDERPGHPQEGVRGDTLLLVRLDVARRWIALLSIPRDAQVELPDIGVTKINVAYSQGYARAAELYGPTVTPQQGGMAFAAATVEEFLGLRARGMRADFVAVVNFAGFESVIDALGGVTIDVPRYIRDDAYPTEDFGTTLVEFHPGPQRMDGKTALIYARTRHADSDFGRAQRQQQVVRAIIEEVRARGWPGRAMVLPKLLRAVRSSADGAPSLLTTLPLDRPDVLIGLIALAGAVEPERIGTFQLGPEQLLAEDGSNLVFDPAAVQSLLDQWAQPPREAPEQVTIQVFNGANIPGLARRISLDLEQAGFRLLPPDNAPFTVERTAVYDPHGKLTTSRRVGRILNAAVINGPPPPGLVSAADIIVVLGPDASS